MGENEYVITNILSETEVIISGGKDAGFKTSDIFLILDDDKYTKIINPKTNKVLDIVYMYKDVLKVKEIKDFYTILESEVTETYNPFAQVQVSSYADVPIRKKLNVDASQVNNVLNQRINSKIRIGDTVVKK